MGNGYNKVNTVLQDLANNQDIPSILNHWGLRMFYSNGGLHIAKNTVDFTKLADSYNKCTYAELWPDNVETVSVTTKEYAVIIHVTSIGGEYTYSSITYVDRINKDEETVNNPLNDINALQRLSLYFKNIKKKIKTKKLKR